MEISPIKTTLAKIFENPDSESEILEIINISSSQTQTLLPETIALIKSNFEDTSSSSYSKLQCIRILKSFMNLKNSSIILLIENEITQSLENYIMSKKQIDSFQTWLALLEPTTKFEFKTYILSLQCIEIWSKLYPKDRSGKDSKFLATFKNLKGNMIEFPPSFFLRSNENGEQKISKRDIGRVKNLIKEFVRNLCFLNRNSCSLLKKVLRSYESSLKESVKKDSGNKAVAALLEEISEILKIYLSWKLSNFCDFPQSTKGVKIVKLVQDPCPKLAVKCDENNEEVVEHENTEQSKLCFIHKRCTSKCLSNYSKIEKNREKIVSLKELVSNLQDQVSALNSQNLNLTEEKNDLSKSLKNLEKKHFRIEKKYLDLKLKFDDMKIALKLSEKQLKKLKPIDEAQNKIPENFNGFLDSSDFYIDPLSINLDALQIERSCGSTRQTRSRRNYTKSVIQTANTLLLTSRCPTLKYISPKNLHDQTISDPESEKMIQRDTPKNKTSKIPARVENKFILNRHLIYNNS